MPYKEDMPTIEVLVNAIIGEVGASTQATSSHLCSQFQLETEFFALLGVYLHTNTKWVESIYFELEIIEVAAPYRGEGESAFCVGLC